MWWRRAVCIALGTLLFGATRVTWAVSDEEESLDEIAARNFEIHDPTLKALHDYWDSRITKTSQQQTTLRMGQGPYVLPISWNYAGKDRIFPDGIKELIPPLSAGDLPIVSRDSENDKLAEIYEIVAPSITWIQLTALFSEEAWNPKPPLSMRTIAQTLSAQSATIREVLSDQLTFLDKSEAAQIRYGDELENQIRLKRQRYNELSPAYSAYSDAYERELAAQKEQGVGLIYSFADLRAVDQQYLSDLDRAITAALQRRDLHAYGVYRVQKEDYVRLLRQQMQVNMSRRQSSEQKVSAAKAPRDAQWAAMTAIQNEISTLQSRKYAVRSYFEEKRLELHQKYRSLGYSDVLGDSLQSQNSALDRRLKFNRDFESEGYDSFWKQAKELQEKIQGYREHFERLNAALVTSCNCVKSQIPNRLLEARYANFRDAYVELSRNMDFGLYQLFLKCIEARKRVREEARARQ